MPDTLPDYEQAFLEKCQENHRQVRAQLNEREKGMMQKINTYCGKSRYDVEDVIRKIEEDEMFAFTFAKDPAKQNLFENLAGRYIQSVEFISDFKKLPSSGNGALFVINGGVMSGAMTRQSGGSMETKSIDFSWKYEEKEFYAFHKYTRESGGAQDNQYNDMKSFIESANNSQNERHFFFAVADGNYFDTRDGQAGVSKIENLKRLSNNQRGIYALRISELHDLLKNICNQN